MVLWRLKQFLKLWGRFLIAGESHWGKARKVITLLFFLGVIPYILRDYSLLIYLQPSGTYFDVRLSLLLAISFAVAWALLTAGRAYELAGVPELRVAKNLEYDQGFFRLRLLSVQKDLDTTVRLLAILDQNGQAHLLSRFPLELEWTHHPNESRVHLTAGFEESVSVANFDSYGVGVAQIRFTGSSHKGLLKIDTGRSVHFYLSVEYAKRKPVNRCFEFHHVGNGTINTSLAVTPPSRC